MARAENGLDNPTMIDRYYGHLARDGREYAIGAPSTLVVSCG